MNRQPFRFQTQDPTVVALHLGAEATREADTESVTVFFNGTYKISKTGERSIHVNMIRFSETDPVTPQVAP